MIFFSTPFLTVSCSLYDAAVLRTAFGEADADLTPFKRETQSGLLELASRFELRLIPKPATVRDMFLQIAKYVFTLKPAAAITAINSGIPNQHVPFWKALGVQGLYSLYTRKSVSPAKVLKMLDEVEAVDPRIIGYLKQCIGSLNSEDLQRFLRFVTGTSCIAKRLNLHLTP